MRTTSIKVFYKDEKMDKLKVSTAVKTVLLEKGNKMIVRPINILKLKNRDRVVLIKDFISDEHGGIKAKVTFLDNNRTGKVDVQDLDELE